MRRMYLGRIEGSGDYQFGKYKKEWTEDGFNHPYVILTMCEEDFEKYTDITLKEGEVRLVHGIDVKLGG